MDRLHSPSSLAPRPRRGCIVWVALGVCAAAASAASVAAVASVASVASGAAPACPTWRIGVEASGLYRIGFADLAAAGLSGEPPSTALALSERGRPVPIFVDDGGDGRFGPGDAIEVALRDRPQDEQPFSTRTLRLACDPARAARLRVASAEAGAATGGTARGAWRRREHVEDDKILVRLAAEGRADAEAEASAGARAELWFWQKLASTDAAPWRLPIDLSGLDREAREPVRIRFHVRGWSKPRAAIPGFAEHEIRAAVSHPGGGTIADRAFAWSAEVTPSDTGAARTFELPPIDATALGTGPIELSIAAPARTAPDGALFADVSLLDWVEVEYPHDGRIGNGALRLDVARAGALPLAAAEPLLLFGDDGSRTVVPAADGSPFELPDRARSFDLAPRSALARPAAIELDRPSTWRGTDHRADLLIVGPTDLLPAIGPLVELRRREGLAVEVVDVQDVYDEWSDGEVDPRAIRDLVAHAMHSWRKPAPRYLLLVGDASWDGKNPPGTDVDVPDATYRPEHGTEFAHVPATPYRGLQGGRARNRVPTWSYPTGDGHAAGDNFFVDIEGDLFPELAVGRLPVVTPEEVAGIVEKLVRYDRAPAGDWARRATFVTTEDPGWQRWSDALAERARTRGYSARTVYAPPADATAPPDADRSDRSDARAVASALGDGGYLLHFIGHGGRFVWRTGPPDWQKQRDLFNLDDLDRLPESDELPIVLSMTCYSAPFDHPSADSIGEKLLRLPKKGAIAVVAAAWRNSPTELLSQVVVGEFLAAAPGERLGDVLVRAKKKSFNRDFVEQYNLLGDPSMPLAAARTAAADVAAAAE